MNNKRYLLVSIKPKYAEFILQGTKKVELRKSTPKVNEGDMLIIYVTKPVKEIVAHATILKIHRKDKEELWEEVKNFSGVDNKEYFSYFSNTTTAVAIEFNKLKKYKNGISLKNIRKIFNNFNPPQTFKYLNEEDFHELRFNY